MQNKFHIAIIIVISACVHFGHRSARAADFSATASMSTGRSCQTATRLPDGQVLVAGGGNFYPVTASYASAELYDPMQGIFIPAGSMFMRRESHTATLLPDGTVLLAGGYDANGSGFLDSAELYDPSSGAFFHTNTMVMAVKRRFHTATLLDNGKVLMTGGRQNAFAPDILNAVDELYDPETRTFSVIQFGMFVRRDSHTATRLPDGKVLIAGGWKDFAAVNSPEIYDPASNTFSPSSHSMTTGRYNHTATLLANGKVLIAGGSDGSTYLNSAELYDPVTDTFSPTHAPMTMARAQHAATLLSNGMVLVTGGRGEPDSMSSAELYDPDTDTFSPTENMTASRYQHTSTMLEDGKVFIAGAWSLQGFTGSAELFDPSAYLGALVRVASDPNTVYLTLQAAYNSAADDDTLLARDIVFSDSGIILDRDIAVRISGGFYAGFATVSGYTTIEGVITVASGSLQVENLIIR